ncbi:MAG TPA: hypothetical protein VGF69_10855 [Thermoanaerobaculia bacterium]|jgi:hypothetical protein
MNCMARRGFLTLSDCGNPASTVCATCARPMCPEHLSPSSGFANCLDCGARATEEENQDRDAAETMPEDVDNEWAYGFRHRYYSTGYRPIYAGSHNDHYYDNYDSRSFDGSVNEQSFDESDEGEGGGGFGES